MVLTWALRSITNLNLDKVENFPIAIIFPKLYSTSNYQLYLSLFFSYVFYKSLWCFLLVFFVEYSIYISHIYKSFYLKKKLIPCFLVNFKLIIKSITLLSNKSLSKLYLNILFITLLQSITNLL